MFIRGYKNTLFHPRYNMFIFLTKNAHFVSPKVQYVHFSNKKCSFCFTDDLLKHHIQLIHIRPHDAKVWDDV